MYAVAKRKRASTFNGAKLRELRQEHVPPLSQSELAELAGVHPVDVSKYERGVSDPSWSAATRLAEALGVGLEVFWNKPAPKKGGRKK
jgi:transcriptional regulator with XRE-family HTH domain